MKIIIGLGNIGREYENTRHNAGFMAIDKLAKMLEMEFNQEKFSAYFSKSLSFSTLLARTRIENFSDYGNLYYSIEKNYCATPFCAGAEGTGVGETLGTDVFPCVGEAVVGHGVSFAFCVSTIVLS